MPVFPSVEWFDAIKNIVKNDPAFRQHGTVDANVGVKVEHKVYEIKFEAFECTGVREASENDLRDMDFWLELPYDQWKDMLTNIRQHGAADLSHTMNTIDLNTPDGAGIPIEQRNAKEVTHVGGAQLAATGALIWNPAFDVTPHHFISGIITERGIFRAPYLESLRAAFEAEPAVDAHSGY